MDLWTFTPRILARLIHQTNYNRTMPQHEMRAEALDEDPIEIYTVNSAQSYVPNSFIKDDPVTGSPRGSGRQAGGPTRKGRQEDPSIDTPISKRITNSGAAWHCAEAGHFRQAEHTDPEGRRRRRIDFRPDWVDSARMRCTRASTSFSQPLRFVLVPLRTRNRQTANDPQLRKQPHVLIQLSQLAQEPGLARLVTANADCAGHPRPEQTSRIMDALRASVSK